MKTVQVCSLLSQTQTRKQALPNCGLDRVPSILGVAGCASGGRSYPPHVARRLEAYPQDIITFLPVLRSLSI